MAGNARAWKNFARSNARAFCALCLLSLCMSVLLACSPPAEDVTQSAQAEAPDARFSDLTRDEYRNGKHSMRITAQLATWYEPDQRLEIEHLAFTAFNTDDGSISASGEAEKATFYESSGDIEFSGYVHLKSAEGDISFKTDHLAYKRALDIFETPLDSDVTINAKNQLFMAGRGLLFDVKQKYYEIRESVSGSVYQ